MDALEKREELELFKETRMGELEEELARSEKAKADVQDQLFKAEEKLLDLKFEKETYDLQFARLQKRIQELEQGKLSSAALSAVIKGRQERDAEEIEEIAGRAAQDSKKKKETVRLREKGTKSVAELEMLVESLKRVIEKQRTECEALKRENARTAGHTDRVASEKALR